MTKNDIRAVHDLEIKGSASVEPFVQSLAHQKVKAISVSGDPELCRSLWLQSSLAGIKVEGFQPEQKDIDLLHRTLAEHPAEHQKSRLRACDVVRDYERRVIPELRKGCEIAEKKQARAEVQQLSKPQRQRILAQVETCREQLHRAIEAQDAFRQFGARYVGVNRNIEDGIQRWMLDPSNDRKSLSLELERQ